MKNKLERYVSAHRDSFDSELPAGHVWDGVDTTPVQQKNKLISFFTRTRIAASVLVLLNATVIFILLQRKPENNASPAANQPHVEQVAGNREAGFERTIDQISKLVEGKQAALKEIKTTHPFLYRKFTDALGQLNGAYKELEKELNNNPNKEELLDAMIQNLSLQQELLNQQLSIYQKVKQQKHGKVNKNI